MESELMTRYKNLPGLSYSAKEQVLQTLKQIFLKLNPDWRNRRLALIEMFSVEEMQNHRKNLVDFETSFVESEEVDSAEFFSLDGFNKIVMVSVLLKLFLPGAPPLILL
jgi:hypothetical protein